MTFTFRHGERPVEGFTIQRGVGRGGFGEVYHALSDAGKEVALKYLRDHPEIELRGVEACMNLKSPHLVSIHDVRKSAEGEYFVIMEYVSGPSLRDLMTAEPQGMGVPKTAFFLREIAKGLSYLHERGLVHRDLKPGNVFHEDGYVKIGDYGLSKFISASQVHTHTASVGSVHYMAPEVGSGHYSRGVDIYALGVILHEMLTGKVPFEGSSMGEILMKHLTAQPKVEHLPEPFGRVIDQALRKYPQDRYQSVEEMVEDAFGARAIQESLTGFDVQKSLAGMVASGPSVERAPSAIPSPNPPYPPPPPPRSRPVDPPDFSEEHDPWAWPWQKNARRAVTPEARLPAYRYAGFGVRAAAGLIDLGLIFLASKMFFPIQGIGLVYVLYYGLFLGLCDGRTPGKRACGVKVVNANGTRLTLPEGVLRALVQGTNIFMFGVNFILMAFDDKKRALHDRIMGTLHVYSADKVRMDGRRHAAA